MQAEGGEGSDLFAQRFDDHEGRMSLPDVRLSCCLRGSEKPRASKYSERGDAVQSPRSIGVAGFEIFGGQDYRVTREAVSHCIQARTLFAGFGLGTRRMARVARLRALSAEA